MPQRCERPWCAVVANVPLGAGGLVRSHVNSNRIALRRRDGSEDILVLDTRSADIIKALYLCFSIQCACNIEQFLQLSPQSQVGNWIHLANTLTPL